MNRTLSGRRSSVNAGRHRFSISSFRGLQQPSLSKKMNRVIKSENAAIAAHESAARQRMSIAAQLSEWGESTEDEAVSDISDKLGVLMAEMGEQEDIYAQNLEGYRSSLKHIRDTEGSVQPTRDQRAKIADEIQRLKLKEPNSLKIETLEQELVRAEAQNLVAEAQLTNVTRQRLKEAYNIHLAAVIERGEKQILLARHARRLLNCLDDTSVIPGDEPKEYVRAEEAKQIIEEAERELQAWGGGVEPVESAAGVEQAGASIPASAQEAQRQPGAESPMPESLEDREDEYEQRVEAQTQDVSASEEGPYVTGTEVTVPHGEVHSMSAPTMDAKDLERQQQLPAATTVDRAQISRDKNEAIGVNGPVRMNKPSVMNEAISTNEPTGMVKPTETNDMNKAISMDGPSSMDKLGVMNEPSDMNKAMTNSPSGMDKLGAMSVSNDMNKAIISTNETRSMSKPTGITEPIGMNEKMKAVASGSTPNFKLPSNMDFALGSGKGEPSQLSQLSEGLNAQVQRVAVPI
ncbi:Eisosome component PIL1-domain-containing protein [Aspergillus egyptiacus]|nr:Eisosome component PIL1-domain-containing protein [Aspergillus egyptiacus]